MKVWLYIFLTLLIMVGMGAYVYTLNPGGHTLEILGVSLTLPIAVWIVLPTFILLTYTLLYLLIHGLRSYFIIKRWRRDSDTLEDALYWSLLNEPKKQRYALDEIGGSATLLESATLSLLDKRIEGLNPRLTRVVDVLIRIKSGEYVDLKTEKMARVFSHGNPYLIQNRLNRLENDEKFVNEVLSSSGKFSPQVREEALHTFAKKSTFDMARKYMKLFDSESFFILLERTTMEEKLGLTTEILNEFVMALNIGCRDYIRLARHTKKIFLPQENLMMFEQYQKGNAEAQHAYLYLLFEYELLDEVENYFEEYDSSDFIKFRALYTLKKEHKGFKLEDVLELDSLCKN
jgi:hypothetical protein